MSLEGLVCALAVRIPPLERLLCLCGFNSKREDLGSASPLPVTAANRTGCLPCPRTARGCLKRAGTSCFKHASQRGSGEIPGSLCT